MSLESESAQAEEKQSEARSHDTGADHSGRHIFVSVVVPVYNERQNIGKLVDETHESLRRSGIDKYEIVFADDGSTDGTTNVVTAWALKDQAVRAVQLARNCGQSAALAAGMDQADGDVVVTMDGDLQNDPIDIPILVEYLLSEDLDCVSGWRRNRDDPWRKTIPSAIQTRLAMRLGPDIHDFGCTLTAYQAEALEGLDLRGEQHRYIPAQLYDQGYRIDELVVRHRPRENGSSHYGVGRLLRGFGDLVFHWFWLRYSARPFHLFGGTGFVTIAIGVVIGLWTVLANYTGGAPLLTKLPELLLSVGLVLFGLLLVVFGVLFEVLTKLYYRDETEYRVEEVVE